MATNHTRMRTMLLAATALTGSLSVALAAPAAAQERSYALDLPPQSLSQALMAFGSTTDQQIVFSEGLVKGRAAPSLKGDYTASQALAMLLGDTGLVAQRNADGVVLITKADSGPQSGSAAGGGAEVEALIVTAQKREEDIQDVPIAISAFTQEQLERSQVAGGPDLMTQVPNMTFTKTNFSGYSIQLRGIGTQAISATTDPAVAVAFNNTPFVRNRFFEQEFYDLQRVEVLRGPQGTLYGRNATAGVVNLISQKPKFVYEAKASADIANYKSTRLEAMVNFPLVEDAVALRLAGAWTKREGFVTNEITGNPIDGRDLWSTRLSLRFTPNDRIDANLIWEHFEEDDDRLRSGKQVCKKDIVTDVGGIPIGYEEFDTGSFAAPFQSIFSQGCSPASLYAEESFQTPNGIALPFYLPLSRIFLPINRDRLDPYVSAVQSRDLRVIESTVDPSYKARSDVAELQVAWDITDNLTVNSETSWSSDFIFSTQDYNRFNTAAGAWANTVGGFPRDNLLTPGPNGGGIFCDPQIGCSDRLVSVDLSTARSRQFSQEFRIASNFDGPFNFSLGANYLRYDTTEKYYVFINALTLYAAISPYGRQPGFNLSPWVPGVSDNFECLLDGPVQPTPGEISGVTYCIVIDPNSIGNLNDQGHNYFLSKNPYKLISYAAFGEVYYELADNLKLTAGLRWTVDQKEAPLIPSWILGSQSVGYPVAEVSEQEWREPTGRLTLDWKPDLGVTDETLLYASYAHGYKAGGSNPPFPGLTLYSWTPQEADAAKLRNAAHPKTFDAEFVDAFELGAKNTLLDGSLTLNLAAFYYDYNGYQISQIIDRSALNQNFDAKVWGLEIEADWRALENLRFGFKGGYENTEVADGMRAIDIMDRTAGHEDWMVYRPFPTYPSNCILPVSTATQGGVVHEVGSTASGNSGGCELAYLRGEILPGGYDPNIDVGQNRGEGFFKDLSGNELPNAPHFTATITADYTLPLPNDWLATLHTDLYYQSEAWTRIFNMEGYDKLKAYTNVNLAAIFTNEDAGWKVMAYVKNVFDRDSITGAFLNSDDTGLTTNVFLTEPRLYGLRVTKEWNGGGLLGSFGARHEGPYPLTVEIGGQVQRHDASKEPISPAFIDEFDTELNPLESQGRDLDLGDGREVKLTYRLDADWTVSLGARFGKTNGHASSESVKDEEDAEGVCMLAAYYCELYPSYYLFLEFKGDAVSPINWTSSSIADKEEHAIVDFAVGRDIGVGMLQRSHLSAGLRYARLHSKASIEIRGLPDWDFAPEYTFLYDAISHIYDADIDANREFKGTGPIISWEASQALLGSERTGTLEADWSLSGGVLFGKQKTAFSGQLEDQYFSQGYFIPSTTAQEVGFPRDPDLVTVTPISIERSRSVTVPTVAASLGLSYKVDRFSIGAGYRWERYFDALDVGYDEAKDADRTIDGPYFKIAVGFGG
jgi:iron complex outermembrane receptor protein